MDTRNKMARLAVPSYKSLNQSEEFKKLTRISEQDEFDMQKGQHRPRIPSWGDGEVPKLLPQRVVRSKTNKSLEMEKKIGAQIQKRNSIRRLERRKTGFNDPVRTLKKKQTWFESGFQRRPSIEFSSSDRVFEAAKRGDLLPLKALLKQYVGFQINQRNTEGLALLHIAVQQGNQDLVTFLLRKGAKVNIRDVDGNTPMHYAVSYEHHALINVLIDSGASQRETNLVGKTPWEGL